MSDRPPISIEDITDAALPASQMLLAFVMKVAPDVLTAVVALETAKLCLIELGKEKFGDDFAEQAKTLMKGFDGLEDAVAALRKDGAFMSKGGDA